MANLGGKNVFTFEAQTQNGSMKFLLVTESPKIFNVIVTIWTFTFFKEYINFSDIKGITDPTFLERFNNNFLFH
jgi:hypothetical protein